MAVSGGMDSRVFAESPSSSGAEEFFGQLRSEHGSSVDRTVERIKHWAEDRSIGTWFRPRGSLREFSLGVSVTIGGRRESYWPLYVRTNGTVMVSFASLRDKPGFETGERSSQLARQLNSIDGVEVSVSANRGRPTFLLAVLATSEALDQFLTVMNWLFDEIRTIADTSDQRG